MGISILARPQIRELVPESQAYMDLLAFERKLDQTIMRKRLDIQEALKRPIKVGEAMGCIQGLEAPEFRQQEGTEGLCPVSVAYQGSQCSGHSQGLGQQHLCPHCLPQERGNVRQLKTLSTVLVKPVQDSWPCT